MSDLDDTVAALQASDQWLRILIEELDLDPNETVLRVVAVDDTTEQRRPLANPTLAERLASNAVLLGKFT